MYGNFLPRPGLLNPGSIHNYLYEEGVNSQLLNYLGNEYDYQPRVFVRAIHEGHPIRQFARMYSRNPYLTDEDSVEYADTILLIVGTLALTKFLELDAATRTVYRDEVNKFLNSAGTDGFPFATGAFRDRQGNAVNVARLWDLSSRRPSSSTPISTLAAAPTPAPVRAPATVPKASQAVSRVSSAPITHPAPLPAKSPDRTGVGNKSEQEVRRNHRRIFGWIVAGLVLIAVAFFWLARRRLVPGLDKLPPDLKSDYVGPQPHKKPVAVVFVHGVFGSNDDSWKSKGGSFPSLLATDPTFQDNTDVFLYEYFTPYLSTAGSIVELADQLRGTLNDSRVFKDHKHVVFLSHSMGGLIVRQFVTSNTDRIPQISMFYFYATPTNGSELASLARYFSANPQLRGMVPVQDNDLLQSIQQRWVGLSSLMAIPSYCAYELLPASGMSVVAGESATALCNRPHDPMSFDHIQIVKPTDRSDMRYTRFVSALEESVPDALASSSQQSGSPTSEMSAEEADRLGQQSWAGQNPNYGQAFRYFTIAADKGYPVAFGHLGWMYELGLLPTGANCVKAMELYREAYSKGAINSSWNIGRLYDLGCGVKTDYHLARCWYEKAQTNGLPEATRDLNSMKQQGRIDSDPCPSL